MAGQEPEIAIFDSKVLAQQLRHESDVADPAADIHAHSPRPRVHDIRVTGIHHNSVAARAVQSTAECRQ